MVIFRDPNGHRMVTTPVRRVLGDAGGDQIYVETEKLGLPADLPSRAAARAAARARRRDRQPRARADRPRKPAERPQGRNIP
jgi:hypothetical protein